MQINPKGFTLIELIVVIVIMGAVALLVMSKMDNVADAGIRLTPLSLKSYLASYEAPTKVDLVCYASCQECDVWSEGKKIKSSIQMDGASHLIAVHLDPFGNIVSSDRKWVVRDGVKTEACFVFSLYPDGHTTSLILQNNEQFYLYRPLSSSRPIVLHSSKELQDVLYSGALLPLNRDDYYENR